MGKNFELKMYFCLLNIRSIFLRKGNEIFSIKLAQRLPEWFFQLHVKSSRFFLSYFLKNDDWPKAYAGPRPALPYTDMRKNCFNQKKLYFTTRKRLIYFNGIIFVCFNFNESWQERDSLGVLPRVLLRVLLRVSLKVLLRVLLRGSLKASPEDLLGVSPEFLLRVSPEI